MSDDEGTLTMGAKGDASGMGYINTCTTPGTVYVEQLKRCVFPPGGYDLGSY